MSVGEDWEDLNWPHSGVTFLSPGLVFTLHFLKIVVEVNALQSNTCLSTCGLGKQEHASVKNFASANSFFLQSNFMELIRLTQS